MSYIKEAYDCADQVIEAALKHSSIDYSPYREEIARVFDEDLWNGNWDSYTDFGDPTIDDIRFIQEDEYDQSMDEDEKPEFDFYAAGHYICL